MSAQYGKCNLDGKPVDPEELDHIRPMLAQYGPDGEGSYCKGNVGSSTGRFALPKNPEAKNSHLSRHLARS